MELFKDIMTAVSNFKLRASEWGKKNYVSACTYILANPIMLVIFCSQDLNREIIILFCWMNF